MVTSCLVKTCKTEWNPNSNVSFFKITKKRAALKEWQEALGSLQESKNYSICSKHFASEYIREGDGRKFLTENAVPTILLNKDDIKTSETPSSISRDASTCPILILLATKQSNNIEPQCKNNEHNIIIDSNNHPPLKNKCAPEKQMHSVQVQTTLCGSALVKREQDLRRKIKTLQTRLRRQNKRIRGLQLNKSSNDEQHTDGNQETVDKEQ